MNQTNQLVRVATKAGKAVRENATAAAVTLMAFAPGMAMAQAASDFDGTEIIAKVVTYTAVGVGILAAFALGRWTLRALGLIGGK